MVVFDKRLIVNSRKSSKNNLFHTRNLFISILQYIKQLKQIEKMQCSFCHNKIQRDLYSCIDHPQVTACQGCYDYTCNRCRAQLKQTQLQFCIGCKQHRHSSRMFGKKYEAFCLQCVEKAYKNNMQGRKVILCKHLYQPDKFDVYQFLRMFCYRCKCQLDHKDLDSGLREIYPLNNNLCAECLMKPLSGDNFSVFSEAPTPTFRAQTRNQPKSFTITTANEQKGSGLSSSRSQTRIQQVHEVKKSSVSSTRPRTPEPSPPLNQNQKRTRIYQTNYESSSISQPKIQQPVYTTSTSGASKMSRAAAIQKWKRIQGSQYFKCMACGHLVLDDGLVNEEVVVCDYCLRKARIQEEMRNNRKTVDQIGDRNYESAKYNNYEQKVRNTQSNRYYDPYTSQPQKPKTPTTQSYQSPKAYQSPSTQYQSPSTQYQSPQSSSINSTYKSRQMRQSQKVIRNTSPNHNTYKDRNLQTRNMMRDNVQYNENLLVQCSKCGIRLELDAAGWEDQNARALCRCCYLDHLELQKRIKERMNYNDAYNTNSKYSTSTYRQTQPQTQSVPTTNSPQPQPRSSPSPSPTTTTQSPTQPIIKQQDSPQKNSRVRRSQSWDDSIIVQPVQDHERRKRQKKLRQENINTIQQVNQEEVYLQRKSQSKISERRVSQTKIQERKSQTKIQERKIGPIQPIIIQDQEQRKSRLKSKLSWDDNIILQPIKRSKPSSPQKPKQQASPPSQASRPVQKGPIEPVITQQQINERRRVKKMQSWDSDIILQPVADHLKRKRQQIQSQLNQNTKNVKKVQQKIQVRKSQKRQYSRSPLRQRQRETKSPLRQRDTKSPLRQRDTKSPIRTNNENRTNQTKYRKQQEINRQYTNIRSQQAKPKQQAEKNYQEYNTEFNNKYKEIKQKLDNDMKIGIEKLEKYAEEEEKLRSLQNSRTSAYSRISNNQQQTAKTSLANSKAEKPSSGYYNPYGSQASVGAKNDDKSTLYSQSGSRVREVREDIAGSRTRQQNLYGGQSTTTANNPGYYYGRPEVYSTTTHYPFQRQRVYSRAYDPDPQHSQYGGTIYNQNVYSNPTQYSNQTKYPPSYPVNTGAPKPQSVSNNKYKDDLTGYRSLERKQRKFCGFCQTNFQTTLRDYFIRGENVCWECYAEYIKLTNQEK